MKPTTAAGGVWPRPRDRESFQDTLACIRATPVPDVPPSDPFRRDRERVHFDQFAKRTRDNIEPSVRFGGASGEPDALLAALRSLMAGETPGDAPTPRYRPVWPILERTLEEAQAAAAALAGGPKVQFAYSIKTNPMPGLLERVRAADCHAEAITGAEVAHALRTGFSPDRIIANGPAKLWPAWPSVEPVDTIFADNLAELESLRGLHRSGSGAEGARSRVFGIRLRPDSVTSRFGLAVSDPVIRAAVVAAMAEIGPARPLGFHFHIASAFVGIEGWWWLCAAFLETVRALSALSGCAPHTLDLGGGWRPGAWSAFLHRDLPCLHRRIAQLLPSVQRLLLEPGSALVQESLVLETRVLQVNWVNGRREVVCDASLAELWEEGVPRRVFRVGPDGPSELAPGADILFGRLCMEPDVVIDGVGFPPDLVPGDRLMISDVGAYAYSGAFPFGSGIAFADIAASTR